MDAWMITRSGVRRLLIFGTWAVILATTLACSQGYVSPAELTATAALQGMVNTEVVAPTSDPADIAIAAIEFPAPTAIPTFTDMPDITSTPKPTRTPDPNATPKPPIQYYTQRAIPCPLFAVVSG